MKAISKENRIPIQILLATLLCIGALLLIYTFAFRHSPMDTEAQQKANGTKTALALTSGALLGPFPTSTAPTATPSDTPTLTPTLPTATPTVTRTPSPTRTLIPTFTPRTSEAHSTTTASPIIPSGTPIPPSRTPVRPTNTSVIIIPTNTQAATQPPPPTDPPTDPPTPIIQITLPPIIQTLIP